MKKKINIAYYIVIALNVVVCIVDIATSRYFGAAILSLTTIWLFVCFSLTKLIWKKDALINELMLQIAKADEKLKDGETKLKESTSREKIAVMELAKMRERAQNAEIKLQQMIDDTPARGKDGRYV